MIPLYKLEKLPRIQRLRKIGKVFIFAENRLALAAEKNLKIYTTAEFVFFTDAAKLLAQDALFSAGAKEFFNESINIFMTAANARAADISDYDIDLFRRALNGVKHILLSETGKDQADWDFTADEGQLDIKKRQIIDGMLVYMEDIRSPFNVGAMFRTAESFGVEKIILSPFCADPRHKRAERTAMGCIDIIPWERQDMFHAPETRLQSSCTLLDKNEKPLPVFALETGGIPIAEFPFPRRGILIAGSEELGVSPRALAAADASLGRVSIPCYGAKASLNVSVAFGIALQAWRSSKMVSEMVSVTS